ncbi:MAG: hypothetical protein MI755_11730 [Sphingomonadales bacterium]|nr:hypothetical protein [Sphingomonadales bacterium]
MTKERKKTKKTAPKDRIEAEARNDELQDDNAEDPKDPADGLTLADGWREDLEVRIWKSVKARELAGGSRPDPSALTAMEEPLNRLMGAATLLHDLACALDTSWDARPMGLLFIAGALQREAQRLYRLHYGEWPRGG